MEDIMERINDKAVGVSSALIAEDKRLSEASESPFTLTVKVVGSGPTSVYRLGKESPFRRIRVVVRPRSLKGLWNLLWRGAVVTIRLGGDGLGQLEDDD